MSESIREYPRVPETIESERAECPRLFESDRRERPRYECPRLFESETIRGVSETKKSGRISERDVMGSWERFGVLRTPPLEVGAPGSDRFSGPWILLGVDPLTGDPKYPRVYRTEYYPRASGSIPESDRIRGMSEPEASESTRISKSVAVMVAARFRPRLVRIGANGASQWPPRRFFARGDLY